MKALLACAALLALAGTVNAQEITYSISPGGSVTFGEVPYSKPTRTPNEIYNPNPLLPYRTPEYTYYSYPTFDIRDAETRRLNPRRLRQEDWLR